MGADGGSMPQRSEVVRVKRKAETADRQSQHAAVWFFCALSKQPLRQPVVACRMGRLYNKDAVYEYLLDPTSHGDGDRICPHVKKPRDVVTLKLAPNAAGPTTAAGAAASTPSDTRLSVATTSDLFTKTSATATEYRAQFMCPVSMREMNGHHRFVFPWSCGCVVAEQAVREVPNDGQCLVCGKVYDRERDLCVINPKAEEVAALEERVKVLARADKMDKAEKKAAKKAAKKVAELAVGDVAHATEGTAADAGAAPSSSTGKRKHEAGGHARTGPPKKQLVVPGVALTASDIAAVPKILTAKHTSDAIKSLYHKSGDEGNKKGNWLTKGTFNHYVA